MGDELAGGVWADGVRPKKRPKPTPREVARKAEIAKLLRERDEKVRRQEERAERKRQRTLMESCRWRHNDYGSAPCAIDGCPACRWWLNEDGTINANGVPPLND